MKFSLVTTVLNNPLVGEALDSALSQKFPGELELIVIDGCSTDGTLKVLEGFRKHLAHFISEKDKGIYDGMNKGLRLATGDVIATLNSDDLLYDDGVLAAYEDAFGSGGADAIYGDLVYVDPADPRRIVRYWKSRPMKPGDFERGWMPPHPTFYAKRALYERLGYFDLRYRYASDMDLLVRFMSAKDVKVAYLNRLMVRMRLGGATNKSFSNIMKGNREAREACVANGLSPSPFYIPMKIIRKFDQYVRRPRS